MQIKYITSSALLALVLQACIVNHTTKKSRSLEPACSNHFKVIFRENTTISNGDSSSQVTLEVKSPAMNQTFEMKQTRSASGVRYATRDGKYIFWEHQGEFTFGTEDSTYCLCR